MTCRLCGESRRWLLYKCCNILLQEAKKGLSWSPEQLGGARDSCSSAPAGTGHRSPPGRRSTNRALLWGLGAYCSRGQDWQEGALSLLGIVLEGTVVLQARSDSAYFIKVGCAYLYSTLLLTGKQPWVFIGYATTRVVSASRLDWCAPHTNCTDHCKNMQTAIKERFN